MKKRQVLPTAILMQFIIAVISINLQANPFEGADYGNRDGQVWIKLGVEEDGIYKITPGDISGAGVNISTEDIATIKIYGTGGDIIDESPETAGEYTLHEQNVSLELNTDGSLKAIYFFGSGPQGIDYDSEKGFIHYNNIYSDKNYYILTFGANESKTPETFDIPDAAPDVSPLTYRHLIYREHDKVSPYPIGAGREWYDDNPLNAPFTNVLHNLDRTGEIKYRIKTAQTSKTSAYMHFSENGQSIGSDYLGTSGGYVAAHQTIFETSFPGDNIAGDSRSKLSIEYDNPSIGVPYLDYIEILYPRYLNAINNEINLTIDEETLEPGKIGEFSVNGFSGTMRAYDITDRLEPKILENTSTTGGLFKFKAMTSDSVPYAQFYISGKTKKPSVEIADFANLTGKTAGAEILLIYPKEFEDAATKYVQFRENQGKYSVLPVMVDYIYNEFGTGKKDLAAVRNYISFAYHVWETKPRFVLFMGDGHYDFRNIGNSEKNFIPVFQNNFESNKLHTWQSAFSTPDFFVTVDDSDDRVDLAVGRFPVKTLEEALAAVEKVRRYEMEPEYGIWNTRSILLADDRWMEDSGDSDYISTNENVVAESFPDFMQLKRLYSPTFPTKRLDGKERRKPAMEAALLSEVNTTGAAIVSYYGHGNPRVWSHEEWMERQRTIPQMVNKDKLFFCFAGTCEYGRFDTPTIPSGAELMFTSTVGGAIGVIAGTRATSNSFNATFGKELYKALFSFDTETGEYKTQGEALYLAKKNLGTHGNYQVYALMGDPATSINMPINDIALEKLCDVPIADTAEMTIKALQKVKIEGSIKNTAGQDFTDFNGKGFVTIYDGTETIQGNDYINESIVFPYQYTDYGGTLNKSPVKVINGKFETEIIIPKDISYSENKGTMFFFAYDEEKMQTAKGSFGEFTVYGVEEEAPTDTQGPDISIRLDYKDFTEGDYVSSSPLLMVELFDESGINTTGVGIGHNIEARIDNDPTPIDLTDKFEASLDDNRGGTIEDVLTNLSPGVHSIKIRAWDVYNNPSEKEVYFRIKDEDEEAEITKVFSVPNPTSGPTSFTFSHTARPPYEVSISIFGSDGRLVRNLTEQIGTLRYAEISFDGTDRYGNSLAQGSYYYSVEINESGKISRTSGSFIILR